MRSLDWYKAGGNGPKPVIDSKKFRKGSSGRKGDMLDSYSRRIGESVSPRRKRNKGNSD